MDGLRAAANWQVALAWLVLAGVDLAFLVGAGANRAPGFSLRAIGRNVSLGVAVAALVAFVLPLAMGRAQATPLILLGQAAGSILMGGLFAGLVLTCLNHAPFVGGVVARSTGAQAFFQGLIVFRSLAESPLKEHLSLNLPGDAFPGATATLGFFLIAWGVPRAVQLGAGLVSARQAGGGGAANEAQDGVRNGGWLPLATALLGSLAGVVALLMYGSYVHLAAVTRCAL
jgi:hypothetical protein